MRDVGEAIEGILNAKAAELAEARKALETAMKELETARARVRTLEAQS